jgi:hypothetical protein
MVVGMGFTAGFVLAGSIAVGGVVATVGLEGGTKEEAGIFDCCGTKKL